MGTRADFYVGRGKGAEWIGSVAYDGYPTGFDDGFFEVASEDGWRQRIAAEIAGRDDGTKPSDGWPWPWDDSGTTDYAYAFEDGKVWCSYFGRPWFDAAGPEPEAEDVETKVEFPKMKAERSAVAGSKRSGLMVFTLKGGG